jgi:ABC-2 type transport system ATP-binding protein
MLIVDRLSGGYAPGTLHIREVSFEAHAGEITALVGLNGAGKSTVLKHVLGLLTPSSGEIRYVGKSKPIRAYIPEQPELYEELTLWEHMEFTAKAYHLSEKVFHQRAVELLERFGMSRHRSHYPATFSKGMRQKTMILCAFLTRPDLLVVDEPFVGLDPLAIRALLELLAELKKEGTSILLSTHVMGLAETYADRFVFMNEGQVRLFGTMNEVRSQAGMPSASLDELFIFVAEERSR